MLKTYIYKIVYKKHFVIFLDKYTHKNIKPGKRRQSVFSKKLWRPGWLELNGKKSGKLDKINELKLIF